MNLYGRWTSIFSIGLYFICNLTREEIYDFIILNNVVKTLTVPRNDWQSGLTGPIPVTSRQKGPCDRTSPLAIIFNDLIYQSIVKHISS